MSGLVSSVSSNSVVVVIMPSPSVRVKECIGLITEPAAIASNRNMAQVICCNTGRPLLLLGRKERQAKRMETTTAVAKAMIRSKYHQRSQHGLLWNWNESAYEL